MIVNDEDKPTLEELALKHFGVMGMKWGVRKRFADRRAERKRLRAANRASRDRDRAAYNQKIDAARKEFDSGRPREAYKKAKAEYKKNRKVIGRREARKPLDEVRRRNTELYEVASQVKYGKERTALILATFGAALLDGNPR